MKLLWIVVYWLKGIWIGVKAMRKIQLGSRVFHDGAWWFVSNWAGQPHMTLSGWCRKGFNHRTYKKGVPREEIQPSRSPVEYIHRFRTARRWYMSNWHRIDVQKKTLNWDGSS